MTESLFEHGQDELLQGLQYRVPQDPELLRRLLRAKDRMDAASQEEWPVRRLARVSAVCEAHFARSFKEAFGVPLLRADRVSGSRLRVERLRCERETWRIGGRISR